MRLGTIKRWALVWLTAHLWGAAGVLLTLDAVENQRPGMLMRLAMISAVAAGTSTVVTWLQWHLPTVAAAFEVGYAGGRINAHRMGEPLQLVTAVPPLRVEVRGRVLR